MNFAGARFFIEASHPGRTVDITLLGAMGKSLYPLRAIWKKVIDQKEKLGLAPKYKIHFRSHPTREKKF